MLYLPSDFDWDRRKARANARKHGVTFEEATSAFNDPNYLIVFDSDHSESEDRYILIGLSAAANMLSVMHVERRPITRIISARKATSGETLQYAQSLIKKAR